MITRNSFLKGGAALVAGAISKLHGSDGDLYRIANSNFSVALRASAAGVWLEELSVSQTSSRPNEPPMRSLLAPPESIMWRSGTAILPESGEWQASRVRSTPEVSVSQTSLVVRDVWIGPERDPIAHEDWSLTLAGSDEFVWTVERRYLRDVRVAADRFPSLVFNTHTEIPGFLDLDMRLDGIQGFPLHMESHDWYEAISPNRVQNLHLAPSGLLLESRMETGFFSYAKQPSDGTVRAVAIGAETVERPRGVEPRHAGLVQRQEWRLRLRANPGVASFGLSLPDPFLARESASFAAVHDQWFGWMIENNPASVAIPHEMGWYPMMMSLYAADAKVHDALAKQLTFIADTGVDADGFVWPRWTVNGYYKAPWGPLHDQIPHFILGMYFHAVNTGNKDFLTHVMPALDRVAGYLIRLDRDGDGVVEIPGSTGLADGGKHCTNWYDAIEFGHKDALIDVYCVRALEAMAEMKAWLGDRAGAAHYGAAHRKFDDGFNRIFWDESLGIYMDWIDIREKMPDSGRRYFYTDQNLLAILYGIASPERAARILRLLDDRYASLCREFHLSRETISATPSNMLPIAQAGDLIGYGSPMHQNVYPNYENGCSFFHSTGLEIAARAAAGQVAQAYETYRRVMRYGYAKYRFWGCCLKWTDGALISEPLNNSLLVLWGFTRGCFGVRQTLGGITTSGAPSPQLEGAAYTFGHLGKSVTLRVRGGRTEIG